MKETIARLREALKAAEYAEAWPDDPDAQRLAGSAFETLLSGKCHGRQEILAAIQRAETLPQERLDLSMLTKVYGSGPTARAWACNPEVGAVLVRRIREAPFFPKTPWRVAWVPGPSAWGLGCVVAWNANEERAKAIQLGEIPVCPGMVCYTPTPIGPMLIARDCDFAGKAGLVFEPLGLGNIEVVRQTAYILGEACWREHSIPGLHMSWEEILKAGGPVSRDHSSA